MILESARLGEIEVDESTIVTIEDGLLGFPDSERFVLVAADESGAYSWLQSVDEPSLAFLVLVPHLFFSDYTPEIPDGDAAKLGIESDADAQLLRLVTATDEATTVNLLGPVVLNVTKRVAKQIVLNDQDWSAREPLVAA